GVLLRHVEEDAPVLRGIIDNLQFMSAGKRRGSVAETRWDLAVHADHSIRIFRYLVAEELLHVLGNALEKARDLRTAIDAVIPVELPLTRDGEQEPLRGLPDEIAVGRVGGCRFEVVPAQAEFQIG